MHGPLNVKALSFLLQEHEIWSSCTPRPEY